MNEFAAKKLGEVLAFCIVGVETLERRQEALEKVSHRETIEQVKADFNDQARKCESIAQDAGVSQVTLSKSKATSTKLRAMRDMYIGDEWDNSAEICEWLGFFEGAAVVHWALVVGVGQSLKLDDLEIFAAETRDFHADLLKDISDILEKIGHERAALLKSPDQIRD